MRGAGGIGEERCKPLLACVRELMNVAEVDDFHAHAVRSLRGLLDDGWVQSETYEPETMTFLAGAAWPTPPTDVYEAFKERAGENPILQVFKGATGSLGPWTWRTVLGSHQAHESLPIYHDVYKRIEIGNQAAFCTIEPDGKLLMQGFSRQGAYSEADLATAELLMPHLSQAYRTWCSLAEARREPQWLEDGLEALAAGLVLLDQAGRVRRWTASAARLLVTFFPATRRAGGRLPTRLEPWIRNAIAAGPEAFAPPPPMTARDADGRVLRLRLTAAPRQGGYLLILDEERPRPAPADLQRRFGLPPRRAEVLSLLCEGKSNAQIAAALGLRPGTAAKHLELIYRDLNAAGRAAAVAKALSATD